LRWSRSRPVSTVLTDPNEYDLSKTQYGSLFLPQVGGGIMIAGGIVEIVLGINAEGTSLEDITKPLTSTAADPGPDAAVATSPT
jgi:hypothetical protein